MNKKTKTIAIVAIVVVVLGGLYYGYNRWRQERLAAQFLKTMYGLESGKIGTLGSDLAGKIPANLAAELAKQAAEDEIKQKEEEAREAAKTPEDRFNETKAVTLTGESSLLAKDSIEPQLTAVFGKIKPTLFSNGYAGTEKSFLATFKIPKIPTAEDFEKLTKEFTDSGYKVAMNSVSADGANILLEKDNITISITYENSEDQEIGVIYMEQAKE